MKNFKILLFAAAAALAFACSPSASVKGTVEGLSDAEIVARRLDVGSLKTIDTLKTGKDGSFRLRLSVAEGDPEFVYLYYNGKRISSLLLESGQKVIVRADTLGNYTVEGSEGSAKLQEVEARYAAFMKDIASESDPSLFARKYVEYYRGSVKYILKNPFSLTVVPVLFQKIDDNAPIFSQPTDAIHFRAACDSLGKVYPLSRFVKALQKETERREAAFQLENELKNASSVGFPNISLPDIKGRKKSLDAVGSKVVLLTFWDSSDASQNNFIQEVLRPIYNDYHKRGLEIYAVCLDTDKARWASVIEGQQLPWINVNDGLGAASPSVRTYNVTAVPSVIVIADGAIRSASVSTVTGLRKELSTILR